MRGMEQGVGGRQGGLVLWGEMELPRLLSLVQAVPVKVCLCIEVVVGGHLLVQTKVLHPHCLEVGVVTIGEGRMHLVHRHRVHARHLVLLLPLHPPVLEPDLDLPLCQAERMRDLDPAPAREISVKVELLF